MFKLMRRPALALMFLNAVTLVMGQTPVATGIYPYGTFDNQGFDTINVGNLNVSLSIPVLNKAGRGIPFVYNLGYDSSVWYPSTTSGANTWTPVQNFGWKGQTELATGYVSFNVSTTDTRVRGSGGLFYTCPTTYTQAFVYHDTFGVQHPFTGATINYSEQPPECDPPTSFSSFSSVATDGSGYTLNVTHFSETNLSSRTGKQISPPVLVGTGAGTLVDTNGNEISSSGSGVFTDTTGNTALTVAGGPPSAQTFKYTDTNGTAREVSMNYTTYTVQTYFNASGIHEYGPLSTSLVSSISLPDGSSYTLTYEATPAAGGCTPLSGTYSTNCVTGRIASITLPTGGMITYAYSGGSNGIESDGSTAGLTRSLTTSAGSSASTWTYTRTTGTGTSTTAVVDALGNNKSYTFVEASNQPYGTSAVYYETSRNLYEGTATSPHLVLTRNTCYNGVTSACVTTLPAVPFGQIDTYEQFNGGDMDGSTTLYTPYGLANISEVWDFGTSSSRGPLLRREVWTYGYSIPNLVTEDEVFDGGGNLAGETVYNYDITTPVTSAGVPQHIPVSGPRGNLTGKSIFASSGTYYNLTAAYEDTGSVLTSTTPAGMTSLTYDSTFVYNTGATLPTPSSGVAIGVSQTFDTAYTGLPLISTDPNSQQTKIPATEYDPMLRPIEIEYPDGGQINWAYTPTTMTTTTIQTPNPTATSEVQLDGYGRLSRTEVANGQSGNDYYQQDTCYDANGNPAFSSYAYQGTGFGATKGCTVLGSTVTNTVNGDIYYYDVLGRVTQIVRQNGETRTYTYNGRDVESIDENGVTRIVQVDGLGRYSVNCEISSTALQGVSPVSCGTDIPGTGFLTTYSYVPAPGTTIITQGAQTRTFQSDWLGRPTLVQEPESGTTTYSYAYNSTGLVVTRTRPMANQTSTTVTTTTTTQYDALNRVLSISYSDGTPMKTFAYDKAAGVSTGTGAPFTDLTQANLIGRLSMASVPLAETAYSYDPLGRANYLDSCLPSGPCGTVAYNRQEHFVYDLAGNPVSSTDGAGTTSTYTVSPASELLTLTSSISNSTNPANIVSSVQNGPNGPISYSLGNGLSSVYGYDTLGRLNGGWVCNGSTAASCTGGTQVYGFTNGWKGVQLQSSYDSVLGQTSTYGYDGFNRLGSRTVTSGTGPNYGWVYDRYGNRWQQNITGGTGSGPTISVSFNSANNQISTSGYTYDAAGNMTDDGFNSYTYDGENNITQVGSSTASYVYNALNQRVRAVVGSTTTEFVFNAAGQRVSTWNGTTHAQLLGKYYWGSQPAAFYTTVANSAGAAAHFEHQDWLGTERMRTTYNGGVEGEFTSLPFGDGQTTISGSDLDPNHYALLDYDAETETDHAQFRQYSSAQGHWMSPDPYMGSYDFGNPQSFNRYVYALNNPLSIIDPEGLYCQWDDGSIDDDPSDGGDTYDQCIADGGTWLVLADSTTITVNGGNLNDPGITVENGNKIDPSNGKPPLTPQQKQCVANAQADHSTAVSRAWSDANTTWGQDVVIGTGGGAVGGCVGGAIFGGVGCIPGGLIGGLGGFAGSVPFGLWQASSNLHTALARASEDYQTAVNRCTQ